MMKKIFSPCFAAAIIIERMSDARNKSEDIFYMRHALELARAALETGEIPVGAVVVFEGRIVGEGANERKKNRSPFAHAEMVALSRAAERLGNWRFDGCALYVTLEPCVMCAGAIAQTRVSQLVFGAYDPRAGACGSLYDVLRDPRLPSACSVTGGVLKDPCAALLAEYFRGKRF